MKIRNGFVSNSSSSSFIMFVPRRNVIRLSELPNWLKNNKFEDHELWTIMEGGCDGDWYRCEITNKRILDVLVKHANDDESIKILIDPIWNDEDECWGLNHFENLPEGIDNWDYGYFNVDYHGPHTVQEWRHYFQEITDQEYWDEYRKGNR